MVKTAWSPSVETLKILHKYIKNYTIFTQATLTAGEIFLAFCFIYKQHGGKKDKPLPTN